MIEETYLKEFDKDNELFIVSFEGDKEDIYELRNYAKMINSVKGETESKYHSLKEARNNDYVDAEEDLVNHPSHYAEHGMECILEMIMFYGFEETMSFCKLNAHKYRKRALDKGGRQDLDKSDWYVETYKDLYVAMESGVTPIQYVRKKIKE